MKNLLFTRIDNYSEFTKSQITKIHKILGIGARLIDVLYYVPHKYVKYSEVSEISNAFVGSDIVLQIKIIKHTKPLYFGKSKTPYKIYCLTKNNEKIIITFFKYLQNYVQKFEIDKVAQIRGKLNFYNGNYVISHPSLLAIYNDFQNREIESEMQTKIQPRYKLINGTKQSDVIGIVKIALEILQKNEKFLTMRNSDNFEQYPEYIQQDFIKVLNEIHNPTNETNIEKALNYLVFEEFLATYFATHCARLRQIQSNFISFQYSGILKQKILNNFQHKLTQDQQITVKEIEESQKEDKKMIRLIQGDVGSGKTIVALISCANVIESGYSCLILAPTTILASQHFQLIDKLFFGTGVNCHLVTGKITTTKRMNIIKQFKSGEINILVGTHALFNDDIIHHKIGLIIIDEQHRFGVNQRLSLVNKSDKADIIMMSATPIPRTLAMGLYGDIEISKIKQKPAFQKEIITSIMSMDKYPELIEHLRKKLENDEKIYWICPLIDDENGDGGVLKRFEDLQKYFEKEKIGLLYGSLKEDKKNEIIREFQHGDYSILISTTVVEVGVNIPNASVVIIEDANKFGLSQLHQLRGRVGRGDKQSYCIMLYQNSENVNIERLKIIKENNDGFDIAECDMKMRGIGNILGKEQSGDAGYKIANITRDFDLMQEALRFAKKYFHQLDNDLFLKQFVEKALQTYFPDDFEKYLQG